MARDDDGLSSASASAGQAAGGMSAGAYTPAAARGAGLLTLVLICLWVHSYLGGVALSPPGTGRWSSCTHNSRNAACFRWWTWPNWHGQSAASSLAKCSWTALPAVAVAAATQAQHFKSQRRLSQL
jgi:hypothetical protein